MKHLIFASVAAQALAKIITLHKTTTPEAHTYTTTIDPSAEVVQATSTTDITLFHATTLPVTIATGTVITTIGQSKAAPIEAASGLSTAPLQAAINPSTYSESVTLLTPTSTVPDASETNISSPSDTSEPTLKTTSPNVPPGSIPIPSITSALASGSVPLPSTTSTLETGNATGSPALPTQAPPSSVSLSLNGSAATFTAGPSQSVSGESYYPNGDIFKPIDTQEPLAMFKQEPIPLELPKNVNIDGPIQTNKFFANLFLNGQNLSVFAQPYELFLAQSSNYYGMGVSSVNQSQRVFGKDQSTIAAPEYYTNPLMLESFVVSATEFSPSDMDLSVTNNTALSVTVQLSKGNGHITLPIAIGMGMVTAVYDSLTPRLFSQLGITTLTQQSDVSAGLQKYKATLTNGVSWNIYVTVPGNKDFKLKVNSDFEIVGSDAIDNLVLQVAVVPDSSDAEATLDKAAGAYPVSNSLGGSVNNDEATYAINYEIAGKSASGKTLLYALTHQVDSLSNELQSAKTDLTLYSPSKGGLTGVLSTKLEMSEKLITDLQWLPYQAGSNSSSVTVGSGALQLLASVVNQELSEDMHGQTNSASTYTAGKSFDKFAYILLVASEILKNGDITKEGLTNLKKALDPWLNNTQPTPFIYETRFKGLTSSAANMPGGSPLDDFGAPYYNDHHFHYGYYVHAAAVIGMLDKQYGDNDWVSKNKDWVNSLVRDVANPSEEDSHFPVYRMFDWFNGHSWAAGLFESGDGKNEESTSEDYNFAYGMKLWGQVVGDKAMEARGDLMLAVMKRTMNNYFYLQDDNKIQPSKMLKNRVAGISFENKIDHTTFFGTNLEYIQGIHMIPMTGATGLIRDKNFVQQEWDDLLSGLIGTLDSGWAGILRSNQALIDPKSAYKWFSQDNFNSEWLDGGASRSWYLAFSAMLGGAD